MLSNPIDLKKNIVLFHIYKKKSILLKKRKILYGDNVISETNLKTTHVVCSYIFSFHIFLSICLRTLCIFSVRLVLPCSTFSSHCGVTVKYQSRFLNLMIRFLSHISTASQQFEHLLQVTFVDLTYLIRDSMIRRQKLTVCGMREQYRSSADCF